MYRTIPGYLKLSLSIGIYVTCVFLIACNLSTTAVIYPSDWPLKYITAPAGSRRAITGHMISEQYSKDGGYTGDMQTSEGDHIWIVGFSYDGSWLDVKKHILDCLQRYENISLSEIPDERVNFKVIEEEQEYFVSVAKLGTNYYLHVEEFQFKY